RPAGARKAEASTVNQRQVRAAVAPTLTSAAARSCVHMPGLPIRDDLMLPLEEIELRTSRSSGPGGQHANVTASRVEASFDVLASSALSATQRERLLAVAGPRVIAVAQDERSQTRNRQLALERLRARLASALAPRKPR